MLLGILALAIIVLFGAIQLWRSPEARGERGEGRVDSALRSLAGAGEYHVLRDLTLPTRGGTTQIDHIVVSRCGVFVIETKNRSGWIFGKADEPQWTQTYFAAKFRFQNPVHQNNGHVKAVQEL